MVPSRFKHELGIHGNPMSGNPSWKCHTQSCDLTFSGTTYSTCCVPNNYLQGGGRGVLQVLVRRWDPGTSTRLQKSQYMYCTSLLSDWTLSFLPTYSLMGALPLQYLMELPNNAFKYECVNMR